MRARQAMTRGNRGAVIPLISGTTDVGPLSLLKETRLNHLGKLAFRPIYWHMLLPGRPIPLVGSRMSTTGKQMGVLDRAH